MSAPVAYLRREAGVLVADSPLMPCETCDLAEICGPEYPCPVIDHEPEPEDDAPNCRDCGHRVYLASSDEYDCGFTGAGCAFS